MKCFDNVVSLSKGENKRLLVLLNISCQQHWLDGWSLSLIMDSAEREEVPPTSPPSWFVSGTGSSSIELLPVIVTWFSIVMQSKYIGLYCCISVGKCSSNGITLSKFVLLDFFPGYTLENNSYICSYNEFN